MVQIHKRVTESWYQLNRIHLIEWCYDLDPLTTFVWSGVHILIWCDPKYMTLLTRSLCWEDKIFVVKYPIWHTRSTKLLVRQDRKIIPITKTLFRCTFIVHASLYLYHAPVNQDLLEWRGLELQWRSLAKQVGPGDLLCICSYLKSPVYIGNCTGVDAVRRLKGYVIRL